MALSLFCGVQTNVEKGSGMDARTDKKGSQTRKSPTFSPLSTASELGEACKAQEMNSNLTPNMGLQVCNWKRGTIAIGVI